jgi:hypothetical protein
MLVVYDQCCDYFFYCLNLRLQDAVYELTPQHTPHAHTLDLQPISRSSRTRLRDTTIVARPCEPPDILKNLGENPSGKRESSKARTHDQLLLH